MAFYLTVSLAIAVNSIAVLGTFMLTGMNGLFSLGQAAFMGLGAYISAICVVKYGFPLPLAILTSIGITIVLAILVGFATLKIRQDFFALATFGFGQAVIGVLTESINVTGGAMGFSNIPEYTTPLFAFISLAVAIAFVWGFRRSHFGRDSLAIRSNELAAKVAGINVFKHKMIVFLISAVFSAYAGALLAFHTQYVEPAMYGWMASVTWIIIVFFGGRDSLTGTVIGALVLLALPEALRFTAAWRILLYCVTILLIINIRPRGLFGTWELSINPLLRLFKPKKQQEAK
jgi:branched-chain amino acid transport system permease protein